MKKLILVLLSTLVLQGCLWQSTKPVAIKAGQDFCKDQGGLHSVDSWWYGGNDLICKTRFTKIGKVNGENWIELERYLEQEYIK